VNAGAIDPAHLPGQGRLIIAFSGGPDSVCLLHLLQRATPDRERLCVHVDHGLDDHSGERARRARAIAESLGTPCHVVTVTVDAQAGPEAGARQARYAALEQAMRPGDTLLTAHHADDQTETVLLRLIRGAGPAGLGGIRVVRPFGPGWLARPILDWPRSRIEAWLARHELDWVEDPSNALLDFDRNFLRHQIIPRLRERWPGVDRSIRRSARLCRGAEDLAVRTVDDDLDRARRSRDALPIDELVDDSHHYRATVIRSWCIARGIDPPPGRMLDSFLTQIEVAGGDRIPEMRWGNRTLRFWRRSLWLEADAPEAPTWERHWDGRRALELPNDAGCLRLSGSAGPALSLVVRSGQDGERLRPSGNAHHRRCKQLLAEAGVPPWQRVHWPRIWFDGRLVALGSRWLEAGFRQYLDDRRQTLVWAPGPRHFAGAGLESEP
jgi:tRNA(Ile)-lysidine synthase